MLEIQKQPEPQAGVAKVADHLCDVGFIKDGDHLSIYDHELIHDQIRDQRADLVLLVVHRETFLLNNLTTTLT